MERFEREKKDYSHRTFFYYYGMCALEFGEFIGVRDMLEQAEELFNAALKVENAENESDPKSEEDCFMAIGRTQLCIVRAKYDKLKYTGDTVVEDMPPLSEDEEKSVGVALESFKKAVSVKKSDVDIGEELICIAQSIQGFANSLSGDGLKKYALLAADKFADAFKRNLKDCYPLYREGTCYFMVAEEMMRGDKASEDEKREAIAFLDKAVGILEKGKEMEIKQGGLSCTDYVKKLGEAYLLFSNVIGNDEKAEEYAAKGIEQYELTIQLDPNDELAASILEEVKSSL